MKLRAISPGFPLMLAAVDPVMVAVPAVKTHRTINKPNVDYEIT